MALLAELVFPGDLQRTRKEIRIAQKAIASKDVKSNERLCVSAGRNGVEMTNESVLV